MKRIFLLIFALICAYTGMIAANNLPPDTHSLIGEKYESWAGVMRIHATPDAISLLNDAARTFEKNNPGVYLHIQSLSAEAICAPGISAPDMQVGPTEVFENGHIIGNHIYRIATEDPQRYQLCLELLALISAQ